MWDERLVSSIFHRSERPLHSGMSDQADALFANLNREFYSALSPPAQAAIDDIVRQLDISVFNQQVSFFAVMAYIIYDSIACFPLEMRLIWRAKGSVTKVSKLQLI